MTGVGRVSTATVQVIPQFCLNVCLLSQVLQVKELPERFLGAALAVKKKISSDTPGCAGYSENDTQFFATAQNLCVTSTRSGGAPIQSDSVIIVPLIMLGFLFFFFNFSA